jgi:hypothetical protein
VGSVRKVTIRTRRIRGRETIQGVAAIGIPRLPPCTIMSSPIHGTGNGSRIFQLASYMTRR